MQEAILSTKNLTVVAKQVNDILLIEQPRPLNDEDNSQPKLKVAGVVLGKLRRRHQEKCL